jgi:hypothetical protein
MRPDHTGTRYPFLDRKDWLRFLIVKTVIMEDHIINQEFNRKVMIAGVG